VPINALAPLLRSPEAETKRTVKTPTDRCPAGIPEIPERGLEHGLGCGVLEIQSSLGSGADPSEAGRSI